MDEYKSQCRICGNILKNPNSMTHVNSQKHQAALIARRFQTPAQPQYQAQYPPQNYPPHSEPVPITRARKAPKPKPRVQQRQVAPLDPYCDELEYEGEDEEL